MIDFAKALGGTSITQVDPPQVYVDKVEVVRYTIMES